MATDGVMHVGRSRLFVTLSTVLSVIMLITTIGPLGGADRNEGPIAPPPRASSIGPSTSHYTISAGFMEHVSLTDNLSSPDGLAIKFERNDMEPFVTLPASYLSVQDLQSRRAIGSYDNTTYIAFIRSSDAENWVSFWLLVHHEQDDITEDPVMVQNFTGADGGAVDLFIDEDGLFYAMFVDGAAAGQDRLYVKALPAESWSNILSVVPTEPSASGQMTSKFDLVPRTGGAILFWKEQGSGDLQASIFEGAAWSAPFILRSNVELFCTASDFVEGVQHHFLFYTSSGSDILNLTSSVNGGLTWVQTILVNRTGQGITSISCAVLEGRVHIAAVKASLNQVLYLNGVQGASWSPHKVVHAYTENGLDAFEEAQICADRSEVLIAVEGSGGRIVMLSSKDNGATFEQKTVFGAGAAHGISLEIAKGYIAFMDGASLTVLRSVASRTAFLRTAPLSPMGVRSWDSIGFSNSGFGNGGTFTFVVIDPSTATQLYPATGSEDILSLPPGMIDGRSCDAVSGLSGAWSAGPGLIGTIVVEVSATRGDLTDPSLYEILINFTAGFPITEDFSVRSHTVHMENCTLTSDGLALNRTRTRGVAFIGPVYGELPWPDVLSIMMTSSIPKAWARAAVADRDMEVLPGFGLEGSRMVSDLTAPNYLMWGDLHIKDIPATVGPIYIVLEIMKEGLDTDPVIESVSLGYSLSPSVEKASASTGDLERGEQCQITIVPNDPEDAPDSMTVVVQHRDPATGTWSDTLLGGPLWKGTYWGMTFHPGFEAPTGTYEFRAFITDPTGNSSGEVSLDVAVDVWNNVPTPPMIYCTPDSVRTGDPVRVGMLQEGSDLETAVSGLTYSLRYLKDGAVQREVDPFNGDYDELPADLVKKGEHWTIEARTSDGANESAPCIIEFTVENTPPAFVGLPTALSFDEDASLPQVPFGTWVSDIDGEALEFTVLVTSGLRFTIEGGLMALSADPNWNGQGLLTLEVRDDVSVTSTILPVTVLPVNDPPSLTVTERVTVDEWETASFWIETSDISDRGSVQVSNDAVVRLPGLEPGRNYFEYANGSFILETDASMVGEHTIAVKADDGNTTVVKNVTLEVRNINDPPVLLGMKVRPEGKQFFASTELTFISEPSDPDLMLGDALNVSWSSSLEGDIGKGANITLRLTPGVHNITVTVTDRAGLSDSGYLLVTVLTDPSEPGETMRTTTFLLLTAFTALVLALIVCVLLFFLLRKKKEEQPEEKKERSEEKEGQPPAGEKKDAPVAGKEGGSDKEQTDTPEEGKEPAKASPMEPPSEEPSVIKGGDRND